MCLTWIQNCTSVGRFLVASGSSSPFLLCQVGFGSSRFLDFPIHAISHIKDLMFIQLVETFKRINTMSGMGSWTCCASWGG